jgi:hypothetical protein
MSDRPSSTQAATPPPPVKKKRHGCLIALGVTVVLVFGLVGAGFALLSSMGKPRDLGVRYTIADYHSAAKKVGLTESAPVGGSVATGAASGFTTDVTYSGSKSFDVVLTSAEMSALLNYSHMPGWPISDAQVVFSGGGGFTMAMYFEYGGVKYPVYATGTASITGGRLSGAVSAAQVLGWTVPGQYLSPGGDYILGVINSRLARLGTLNVTSAEGVDGGLHLVGTGPAKAQPIGQ